MKQVLLAVIVFSMAGFNLARADGYPEELPPDYTKLPEPVLPQKYRRAEVDKKFKKELPSEPPANQTSPKLTGKLTKNEVPTYVAPSLDISPKVPEKFRSGIGVFAGSGSYAGVHLDLGWIPSFADDLSLSVGVGGAHIADRRTPEQDYQLTRLYGRAWITYSLHLGKFEVPVGVFHDRAIRAWKNTYRVTGGTVGLYRGKWGLMADVGYNAVDDGFTPRGTTFAVHLTRRFWN